MGGTPIFSFFLSFDTHLFHQLESPFALYLSGAGRDKKILAFVPNISLFLTTLSASLWIHVYVGILDEEFSRRAKEKKVIWRSCGKKIVVMPTLKAPHDPG